MSRSAPEPQLGVVVAVVVAVIAATLLDGRAGEGTPNAPAPAGTRPERSPNQLDVDPAAVADADEQLADRLAEEPDVLAVLAEAAAEFDVATELVLALAWHESRWRPDAVSPAGAVGVLQVMPSTAERVAADVEAIEPPVDLTDPADNAAVGAAYVSGLLDRYDGDARRALLAYNQGAMTLEERGPLPSAAAFAERVRETAELLADAAE